MKAFFRSISFLSLHLLLSLSAPAAQPEQDAEACIMPFLDVLANPPSGGARAFQIRGRVESVAGIQFENELPPFELSLQAPNRLKLQFPLGKTEVVVCRNDQQVWVSPSVELGPLFEKLPPARKDLRLPPMQLPLSGQQILLLPALLQIVSKGESPFEGVNCRVVDIRITPQLARLISPDAEKTALRLWLSPQNKPVRLGIQSPGVSAVVRIDHLQFAANFPENLFAPNSAAMEVPVSRLQTMLETFGKDLSKLLPPPQGKTN